LLFVSGCGLPPVRVPKDSDRYEFEAGRIAVEGKQYLEAQNHLKRFLDLHPGHALADSAQFLLGLAQYRSRSYAESAVEFSILVREFPRSELRDDAAYQECLAYFEQMRPAQLDPTLALRARSCLNEFLLAYPDSPHRGEAGKRLGEIGDRLAEKDYRLGVMFANLKRYDAALIYLDEVLRAYPDSRWIPEVLLWKGRCLLKLGRGGDAAAVFRRLVESYPEHDAAGEARRRLQELEPPGERAARQLE
jgi:outer membrane protein assembly factor BamD